MIETERLVLRPWRTNDAEQLFLLSQHPEVARYLGPPPDRAQVHAIIARQQGLFATHGHCLWAMEHKDDRGLLGFCGLQLGPEGTPIAGQIEIGWRLGLEHWGRGYAREAAEASLAWAWQRPDVARIWAVTVPANRRSLGLMERLGMSRHPELDFLHPNVPERDPLKPHVTYCKERETWS